MADLTLEKDVQKACVALLEGLGAKVHSTSQYRVSRIAPGISDLIVLHRKLGVVFLEVKRPGGKQSPQQQEFQEDCEMACTEYWLVHSEEELRDCLTDAGVLR